MVCGMAVSLPAVLAASDLNDGLRVANVPWDEGFRCGLDIEDANARCGGSCSGNEDVTSCPAGQYCLGVSTTCGTYCGASWETATCDGTPCGSNDDCDSGETCFPGILCGSEDSEDSEEDPDLSFCIIRESSGIPRQCAITGVQCDGGNDCVLSLSGFQFECAPQGSSNCSPSNCSSETDRWTCDYQMSGC